MEEGKLESEEMLLIVDDRKKYLIYKIIFFIYKINCTHMKGEIRNPAHVKATGI